MATARVNGIEIAYDVHGEGFPLVLAHGYMGSRALWDGQLKALAARYRVVVYDIRGHGESGAPPAVDPGYTLDTYVEDQRALMEQLGIGEAHVGGLSMGGGIAMRFALAHPRMVRALLLFDTSAGPGGDDWGSNPVRTWWQQNRASIEERVRAVGVRQMMSQFSGDAPGASASQVAQMERMTPDGFLGAGDALFTQSSVLARMPEISAPTLVLVGEQDFLLEPSRKLHARLPNARFVLIKDSNHVTCLWQPDAFRAAVLDFLSDVEAGRPVAGHEER